MKTMRKLFTVLLALAMTLALAVPAFAADTTGSITIPLMKRLGYGETFSGAVAASGSP